MLATGNERCPVTIFQEFLSRRLPEYAQPVHFICLVYQLRPRKFRTSDIELMGVNKLNDMMKSLIKERTLEDSWKTFFNHTARKTVAGEVKKSKPPKRKVSG